MGYRDTGALRFNDETQAVRARATGRATDTVRKEHRPVLARLPLDILSQARAMFYGYYITGFCQVWDFLYPYRSSDGPDHLTLSIDAVSLAYLSHQVNSQSALQLGRRKYVSALRRINTALQTPGTTQEATTLQTSMLLDLFERITCPSGICQEAKRVHVDGALALVKLKGLHTFVDDVGLKVLTRLLLNASVCYFSQGDSVSLELHEVRNHMAQFTDTSDPKWKMSGLVLEFTDLMSSLRKGEISEETRVQKCIELNDELEEISKVAPLLWSYKRRFVAANESHSGVLNGFYDVYSDRIATQRSNVLRILRLFLCKEVVTSLATRDDPDARLQAQRASTAATTMIQEVCASVSQMTDCEGAAQHKLPSASITPGYSRHNHTLSHLIDAYVLIFPLYIACWSRACTDEVRAWIIEQLDRIAEHFGIKEARKVVEILQRPNDSSEGGPWDVYRLLGSYAFAA
jgi:hypothetical protein